MDHYESTRRARAISARAPRRFARFAAPNVCLHRGMEPNPGSRAIHLAPSEHRVRADFTGPHFFDSLARPMQQCSAMKTARVVVALLAASVVLSALTGCVKVAPYERGTLAHPTMSASDP